MDPRTRREAYDYSHIAAHIAGAFFVIFFAVLVLYLIMAPVKAAAFDADGVRCYHRAFAMECLKTANPGG